MFLSLQAEDAVPPKKKKVEEAETKDDKQEKDATEVVMETASSVATETKENEEVTQEVAMETTASVAAETKEKEEATPEVAMETEEGMSKKPTAEKTSKKVDNVFILVQVLKIDTKKTIIIKI